MKKKNCGTCRYHVLIGDSDTRGGCFRFPVVVEKMTYHWCGEHKAPKKRRS